MKTVVAAESMVPVKFKVGDSVRMMDTGFFGRVAERVQATEEGIRRYRVRAKCPSPKPIYFTVREDGLTLVSRSTVKSNKKTTKAKAKIKRAVPLALRHSKITEATFNRIVRNAEKQKETNREPRVVKLDAEPKPAAAPVAP